MSPSLRGSGLKYLSETKMTLAEFVSLFTREWIEITATRQHDARGFVSPSLRGSGLKLGRFEYKLYARYRLPLYEGVD